MRRALWPFLLILLLAACRQEPVPAHPALWEVRGENGEQAWLFGTIHSLERPVEWKSSRVAMALDAADLLIVEVADLEDSARISRTFAKLATSPGHPPLSRRVSPAKREALEQMLRRHRLDDNGFSQVETWAAALTLAQAETRDLNREYGIDLAVMSAMKGKPVEEMEGAAQQLSIFDRLPESEQRDLLEAVVTDSGALDPESRKLAEAWRSGDMKTIERETDKGMLADPELREALLESRNSEWSGRISRDMEAGRKPFVAVGAAHMAGPDGLPALLAARGYTVTRVQ